MGGPLADLFVLEFGVIFAAPYCAQLLGELGAEVLKVEPLTGARGRTGGFHYAVNHSKKSLAIDLQRDEGRQIMHSLVKQADVVLENFRPGAMDRLGLGYEELSAINPRLVYCSISGYGDRGPWREAPGQDLLIQAVSGLMSIVGYDDRLSVPAGTFPADIVGALLATIGIMTALHERERSGLGQQVKTSLLMALIATQPWEFTEFLTRSRTPKRVGSGHYLLGPVYGGYRVKDGEIVMQGEVKRIAQILGCKELLEDPRFDNPAPGSLEQYREEIRAKLQASIENRSREDVLRDLSREGIWCMPVLSFPEVCSHPQLAENEMLASYDDPVIRKVTTVGVPLKLGRTPGAIQGPPPALGQHSEEILTRRLGLSSKDLERLREIQVIP